MNSMSLYRRKLGSNCDNRLCRFANRSFATQTRFAARLMIAVCLAALALIIPRCANAVVISDNFSDGNDTANPTWTHMDGTINSTGRTWDASTGQYFMHSNNDATDAS